MAKDGAETVAVVGPDSILAAEFRAGELGETAGFDRGQLRDVVTAAGRMANMLLLASGKGRLVLALVEKGGLNGLEIVAEPGELEWRAENAWLPSSTFAMMDEISWVPDGAGPPRLVARKWESHNGKA
jgi:hypothetical protein